MNLKEVNKPKPASHNFITLRTTVDDKFKTFLMYLAKNDYRKILVIVNKRQEAVALNKKLLMESKTSINLFDSIGL